jgi:hypothetical protein
MCRLIADGCEIEQRVEYILRSICGGRAGGWLVACRLSVSAFDLSDGDHDIPMFKLHITDITVDDMFLVRRC